MSTKSIDVQFSQHVSLDTKYEVYFQVISGVNYQVPRDQKRAHLTLLQNGKEVILDPSGIRVGKKYSFLSTALKMNGSNKSLYLNRKSLTHFFERINLKNLSGNLFDNSQTTAEKVKEAVFSLFYNGHNNNIQELFKFYISFKNKHLNNGIQDLLKLKKIENELKVFGIDTTKNSAITGFFPTHNPNISWKAV